MIAVDTNILVRYAVKDDARQTALATAFLGSHRCLVLKTVLLECAWVLSSPVGYNLPRQVVHARLLHILGLSTVEAEDPTGVAQALAWYAAGLDFADALHLAGSAEVEGMATFDRRLADKARKLAAVPTVQLVG
ncbi:MAG: type II toxin-antitoxin system VapC family toxin [Deferrisomatales bacterium]|nr:type II toxin-antitoxin system VapC family toxin [Deferrisomatales bacterium]